MAAVEEIREINHTLSELREQALVNFPLTGQAALEFLSHLKEYVMEISRAEKQAVDLLRQVQW